MIFVTLGTQDKSFVRLLNELEKIDFKEEVIVQAGYTKFESEKMKVVDYLEKDEFERAMKEASLLITHAGVGSILGGLQNGKKVIACPRLARYGEHQNDHQLQIADTFSGQGYLLKYEDGDDLEALIKEAQDFTPKPYVRNNENFVKKLRAYLEI